MAYFITGPANNGGTEAVNGIIELHRRLTRGFRNRHNYRLRMLLAAGGLTPDPHRMSEEPVKGAPRLGACDRHDRLADVEYRYDLRRILEALVDDVLTASRHTSGPTRAAIHR
ncbi:transposase [Tessaracoccus palaemonis]|uniref:Transposase n=1 Tax=Tessaracoccus palaemonis TaxID=2829499 RepID=A0ABX8SQ76_9ACTN|nr:transposase [Tessaracoccus palaemonis]